MSPRPLAMEFPPKVTGTNPLHNPSQAARRWAGGSQVGHSQDCLDRAPRQANLDSILPPPRSFPIDMQLPIGVGRGWWGREEMASWSVLYCGAPTEELMADRAANPSNLAPSHPCPDKAMTVYRDSSASEQRGPKGGEDSKEETSPEKRCSRIQPPDLQHPMSVNRRSQRLSRDRRSPQRGWRLP